MIFECWDWSSVFDTWGFLVNWTALVKDRIKVILKNVGIDHYTKRSVHRQTCLKAEGTSVFVVVVIS